MNQDQSSSLVDHQNIITSLSTLDSYHITFAHLLSLLIITSIHQLFFWLSFLIDLNNFSDVYDVYYDPKISILKILMISDLVIIIISNFLVVCLIKSYAAKLWLGMIVLILIAISIFFYVYEIVIFFTYVNQFDRISLIFGILLRGILLIYEILFLIYKTKLARERNDSSYDPIVQVSSNTSNNVSNIGINSSLFIRNKYEKNYGIFMFYKILLDLLKMGILYELVIALIFVFFSFGDGSITMTTGTVFAFIDFLIILFSFFLYTYSETNKNLIKKPLILLWISVGSIAISYSLTLFNKTYYEEKLLYSFALLTVSATLRVLLLIMSGIHYKKSQDMIGN